MYFALKPCGHWQATHRPVGLLLIFGVAHIIAPINFGRVFSVCTKDYKQYKWPLPSIIYVDCRVAVDANDLSAV